MEKVSELIRTSGCPEHPAADAILFMKEIWDEILAVGFPVDGVEPPHYSATIEVVSEADEAEKHFDGRYELGCS